MLNKCLKENEVPGRTKETSHVSMPSLFGGQDMHLYIHVLAVA